MMGSEVTPARRILMLAYHFPPVGGGGVQRNAKFARYLPEHGYTPVVVTGAGTADGRWTPRDETLLRELPETEVIRLSEPARHDVRPLRWRLGRLFGLASPFERWWSTSLDELELDGLRDVSLVYASLVPYETAEASLRLANRLGKPFVADLQDPWALDDIRLYPTFLQHRAELATMRRLLGEADMVVLNTNEAGRRFRETFPELAGRAVVIPNGFDPSDFAGEPPVRDDDAFRIVHAGYLYTEAAHALRPTLWLRRVLGGMPVPVDLGTRTHVYLLEAVARLIEQDPTLGNRIEVHLVGVVSKADLEYVDRFPFVHVHGYVEHEHAIALMRSADLLFLPMHDLPAGRRAAIVPGKAYEYLATERPILAAVPHGDLRDLLVAAGCQHIVAPKDVAGMSAAIACEVERVRTGRRPAFSAPRNVLEPFDRRRLTEDLVETFDRVRRAGAFSAEPACPLREPARAAV